MKILEEAGYKVHNNYFSNEAQFTGHWNNMSDDVDIVIINSHGSPDSIEYVKMNDLDQKTIDTLVLLTCNSAHQNVTNTPVSQFMAAHNIRQAVGTDGLHQRLSNNRGGRITAGRLSSGFNRNATKIVIKVKGRVVVWRTRYPKGFMLYRNGKIKSIGYKYKTVLQLLKKVGK